MRYRSEKDSLGEKKVPLDSYYGIHVIRSLDNFQISSLRFPFVFIRSLAIIKLSCAAANIELKYLDRKKGSAIIQACNEIINGKFIDQFVVDVFQSGSGTSTNMNANEVIANRASEILGRKKGYKFVHPNDDVNKGQSTNDVFPSSIKLASLFLMKDLLVNMKNLELSILKKSSEFMPILKSGRTHLQDAVPITLGQEFNSYATMISKHIERIHATEKYILSLGIGGNAVGTGINTHPNFRFLIIKNVNKLTKFGLINAADCIESTNNLTDIAYLSATLKTFAIDLNKIANDLRLLSSGPKTGLNELILPAVEPGSSIMPGKINPSICEIVNMVCYQVFGNDTTISMAAQSGLLELNTTMPIIAFNILQSLEIMSNAIKTFDKKCISGIVANKEKCLKYFEDNPTIATALNPYIGYDKACTLVKESLQTNKAIRQLLIEKKLLKKEQIDKIFDTSNITKPNLK